MSTYLARIKARTPLERFEYYITERFEIRERRRMDLTREQWTSDPILKAYKFTNVRRAWDFTSEWLTREWYAPYGEQKNAGFAAAVARFICYVPSLEVIKFPQHGFTTWMRHAIDVLEDRASMGLKVFTSAYMIAGGGSAGRSKVEWVFNDIIHPAHDSGLLSEPWHGSIDDLHNSLRALAGWGDFMTQEVVLDLQQTFVLSHKSVEEKRMYGWAGPGAIRGLNRLNERSHKTRLTRDEAQVEMVSAYRCLLMREKIPRALLKQFTLHDVEFSLCEFDKYERVLWGQGTPKQKFVPREDSSLLELF